MLFDKDVLKALHDTLASTHPQFNIHVFLLLLKSTTRPMGYPPYTKGVNDNYYLNLISNGMNNARAIKNAHHLNTCQLWIGQLMFCFCYLQKMLFMHGVDEKIIQLLNLAIDARQDTTDEEQCAEKSLLALMHNHPKEVLELIANNHQDLQLMHLSQVMQEQITHYGTIRLKQLIEQITETTALAQTASHLAEFIDVLRDTHAAIKELDTTVGCTKIECKRVIGFYLANKRTPEMTQDWLNNHPFLHSALDEHFTERATEELKVYIDKLEHETDYFSFFKRYPNVTKLSSANKVLQNLQRKSKKATLSELESAVLKNDPGSQLTNLYQRYLPIMSSF